MSDLATAALFTALMWIAFVAVLGLCALAILIWEAVTGRTFDPLGPGPAVSVRRRDEPDELVEQLDAWWRLPAREHGPTWR